MGDLIVTQGRPLLLCLCAQMALTRKQGPVRRWPQAATFNVNGRPPPEGADLSPWLGAGRYADIVAVGFQVGQRGRAGPAFLLSML